MKKLLIKRGNVAKKPLTSFRLQVFSRHPSHNCLRAARIMLPFRAMIRFGSTTIPKNKYIVEINSPESVKISSNKLLMKEKFQEAGVSTAKWWKGTKENVDLLLSSQIKAAEIYPIVAKSLHGSRCRGNYLLKNLGELKDWVQGKDLSNYIFEKYYSYNREYRLHIWEGGCFYTCRKMLKTTVEKDKRWFRNDSNSIWIIEENPSFDKPCNWNVIVEDCVKALKSTGLDVAAFDVRVQSSRTDKGEVRKSPAFIILESNSAPSMGQITEQKYIQQLPLIAKTKFAKLQQ